MAFSMLFSQLPSMLIAAVGIAVAVGRWQRHPMASMLVTLGLSLRLFSGVASAAFASVRAEVGSLSTNLFYTGFSLVGVLGLGLLVAAAFADRGLPPR
jgi:hypothetical protein